MFGAGGRRGRQVLSFRVWTSQEVRIAAPAWTGGKHPWLRPSDFLARAGRLRWACGMRGGGRWVVPLRVALTSLTGFLVKGVGIVKIART